MSNKKESAPGPKPPAPAISKPEKLYHAMRNGTLYRSTDGTNWEIETDPDVPLLPEGSSRVSKPAKGPKQQ
jgi:hypothetical protein